MALAGRGGSIWVSPNKIAEMTSWSLELSVDTIDTTNFDSSDWGEFLMSFKSWTVSSEGNFKPDDTQGQMALISAYLNSVPVTLLLKVASGDEFQGQAYVTSVSIENPVDDKVAFSCELQGTGAITVPGA